MTVTELNRMISEAVRSDPRMRDISVSGEISGFRHHIASGHWYFSMKDRESVISCVMFRQNTFRAELRPKDGDLVTVSGYVELYTRDGKIQLYCVSMKRQGTGTLYEQFEALKKKLLAEGLFDTSRKRILPMLPRKVAVVTSESGAALHDILNVSGKRYPSIPIVLVPTGVQGAGAGAEIAAALAAADRIRDVDVIIVARGGGSMEDLWCFNDELVVRAVASCSVPVVSGVGHETDVTLCDLAADVRASTPSNAAEIVFPDRKELQARINLVRKELRAGMAALCDSGLLKIRALSRRLLDHSPERVILHRREKVLEERNRLDREMRAMTDNAANFITYLRGELNSRLDLMLNGIGSEISRIRTQLSAVSPLSVLDRGYAIVYDDHKNMITRAGAAEKEKDMTLRFADGEIAVSGKGQAWRQKQ